MILINNIEIGEPLAIVIGLVGTGLQGLNQLIAVELATRVKRIYLNNRSPEKLKNFIHDFQNLSESGVDIIPVFNVSVGLNGYFNNLWPLHEQEKL